jgi:8-oxo-dGTP diphosphatase
MIENFLSQSPRTDTLIILRHTKALERGDWDEEDSQRTLDELGFDQAQLLIKHLQPFAIEEIYTSDFTRCVQTVTPLAHSRGLSITQVPSLNEYTFNEDPLRAVSFANALKQDEKNILICSHNPVIPTMLRGILNTKLKNKDLIKLEPGDAWIVHRVQGEIVGLDYLSIKN